MKEIELNHGYITLIDDEDYELISSWKWFANDSRGIIYARGYKNGKRIMMHRLIMSTPEGMDTDHINHNSLDNRKENLRICTHSQNNQNMKKPKGNKSGYKGVFWNKKNKNWRSTITCNGKQIEVGSFDNAIDAAKAYDKKSRELSKEFSSTNFMKDGKLLWRETTTNEYAEKIIKDKAEQIKNNLKNSTFLGKDVDFLSTDMIIVLAYYLGKEEEKE